VADEPVTRLVAPDVRLGARVYLGPFVNLYGCEIGDETRIGAFVEITSGVRIGRRCKISSHTYICTGVTIEDGVFVGHGVMFINDRYPAALTPDGRLQAAGDFPLLPTLVRRGASIGTGAVILGGLVIGEGALVGAGAVVTHDVPDGAVVVGVPARIRARRPASAP
jgi:UDP-2-acetamido-3-amino-2,3-dideoxy-glucuronate N-acetyltransferase